MAATRAVVMTKPRLCSIDTITIDACMEETHELNNTVTDHPVEEGFNASDHVRPDPDMVTLRCLISNTPLSREQQQRTIQEGNVKFQTTAQQGVEIGAVDGRANDAYKKLLKIRNEGTLIKVVTTLRTYPERDSSTEGMAINGITIPRTIKNYDGLEFTIRLKQIKIVKNRSTTDRRPKDVRAAKKKHQGATTTKQEVPESAAFRLGDASTGYMANSDNSTIKGIGSSGQSFLHR